MKLTAGDNRKQRIINIMNVFGGELPIDDIYNYLSIAENKKKNKIYARMVMNVLNSDEFCKVKRGLYSLKWGTKRRKL